jgi:hypothetical protein
MVRHNYALVNKDWQNTAIITAYYCIHLLYCESTGVASPNREQPDKINHYCPNVYEKAENLSLSI